MELVISKLYKFIELCPDHKRVNPELSFRTLEPAIEWR